MPHQGISTKLHRKNSLMLHGRGNILRVLHFALKIFMKETLFRRSVQDDKSEGALFGKQLKLQMQKVTSSQVDRIERASS